MLLRHNFLKNCFCFFLIFSLFLNTAYAKPKPIRVRPKIVKLNSKNFDYGSLKKFNPSIKQAVVYGWNHCKYEKILDILDSERSFIKKTFDYTIGIPIKEFDCFEKVENLITLEGWKIEQIPISKETISQECKAGLVNMVFENYKRLTLGKPLIPVLFIIDIDNNKYHTDYQTVTTRKEFFNELITNRELRRCYKLCHELEGNLKKIEDVAKQTFFFVKLTKNKKNKWELVKVKPYWAWKEWDFFWIERLNTKPPKKDDSKKSWRIELERMIDEFDRNPHFEPCNRFF